MKNVTKSDTVYLKHILESIKILRESTFKVSRDKFESNTNMQDAAIRRIEIIGEAAKNISPGLKFKHPEINWKGVTGMRDVLIHAYFSVDVALVWDVIKKDIPKLENNIKHTLKEMSS